MSTPTPSTARPVITAAQSCAQGSAVMAFDILPESLSFEVSGLGSSGLIFPL